MGKYICVDCFSQQSDNDNGFTEGLCINGHDNWLELTDDILLLKEASDNHNIPMEQIVNILLEDNG